MVNLSAFLVALRVPNARELQYLVTHGTSECGSWFGRFDHISFQCELSTRQANDAVVEEPQASRVRLQELIVDPKVLDLYNVDASL